MPRRLDLQLRRYKSFGDVLPGCVLLLLRYTYGVKGVHFDIRGVRACVIVGAAARVAFGRAVGGVTCVTGGSFIFVVVRKGF